MEPDMDSVNVGDFLRAQEAVAVRIGVFRHIFAKQLVREMDFIHPDIPVPSASAGSAPTNSSAAHRAPRYISRNDPFFILCAPFRFVSPCRARARRQALCRSTARMAAGRRR